MTDGPVLSIQYYEISANGNQLIHLTPTQFPFSSVTVLTIEIFSITDPE